MITLAGSGCIWGYWGKISQPALGVTGASAELCDSGLQLVQALKSQAGCGSGFRISIFFWGVPWGTYFQSIPNLQSRPWGFVSRWDWILGARFRNTI